MTKFSRFDSRNKKRGKHKKQSIDKDFRIKNYIKNEKNFKSVSFKNYKNAYEVTLDKNNVIENSFRKFSLVKK
mgnify:CR=1 FL=1